MVLYEQIEAYQHTSEAYHHDSLLTDVQECHVGFHMFAGAFLINCRIVGSCADWVSKKMMGKATPKVVLSTLLPRVVGVHNKVQPSESTS